MGKIHMCVHVYKRLNSHINNITVISIAKVLMYYSTILYTGSSSFLELIHAHYLSKSIVVFSIFIFPHSKMSSCHAAVA
jgi:hypothetical protein